MANDTAYCINKDCPYKDCDRHISHLEGKTGTYTFANLDGVCKRYIRYLMGGSDE